MQANKTFQLGLGDKKFSLPKKKRIIIGSSDTADLQIKSSSISAIHCLIEFNDSDINVYSLNPDSKVLVNNEEVVSQKISTGDVISIGKYNFSFGERESTPDVPKSLRTEYKKPKLPKSAPRKEINSSSSKEDTYNDNYPLSKDPDLEFSEYIFEDEGTIYPIFKYEVNKRAAEIIILFNEKIFSVDFLPEKDGVYHLVGRRIGFSHDIELPYLGLNEKVPFVEIKGGEVFVNSLNGFKHLKYADNASGASDKSLLGKEDIHLFEMENLKIFVRGDEAPPQVKAAPLLRRDGEFKKYLLLILFIFSLVIAGITNYEVDPELEKEKVPERLAKIIYKPKKLRISKRKEQVTKRVEKKKKQTAPKTPQVTKKDVKKQPEAPKSGVKKAKTNKIAKKAPPKKGPTNKKKVVKRSAPKRTNRRTKTNNSKRIAKSKGPTKRRGKVDVYKSADFSSSISSLMAKGGSLAASAGSLNAKESFDDGVELSIDDSARVKTASVSKSTGSLEGSASGKVESSKGTSGLVQSKKVYVAGMPFREVILGSIDRNDIMRILLENVPQFRYCYQRALDTSNQAVAGVMIMEFTIGARGNVVNANSKSVDSKLPRSVTSCVISHLRTIRFPSPKGGGQVSVTTPLNLYGRSQ